MEQQFLESEQGGKAIIAVDSREDTSFDDALRALGAIVERKTLEVGDFICSGRLVVERKTRSDFEASIIDGRLFSQLANLRQNYERAVIVVEGEESAGIVQKESLLGAYVTVIADFGAALFFTRDRNKTAELIYAMAKHEQLAKKQPMRIYAKRKTFTVSQNQRAIIEAFPMVGPKLSKALLEHFGNVENVIKANERELLEVEGMGKKRAKAMRSVIENHYSVEEDDFKFI
jgi:Fanconi anemia group M protein